VQERLNLVTTAADILDRANMVRYNHKTESLGVTDVGRVASHYYIKYSTIEAFNTMLTPHLSDSEALHVLCSSAEFDQLKVRPEEVAEIETLAKHSSVRVRGSETDTAGKVSILLQAHQKQCRVNSFTLQSDTYYIVQNGGRICRAIFEICLKKGWQTMAHHFLNLSKGIDKRMNNQQTPLRQFGGDLPDNVIKYIENNNFSVDQLFDMTPSEIGDLCHNKNIGAKVLAFIRRLPYLEVEAVVRPITRQIIRLDLSITPAFEWSDKYHKGAEGFWVWIEDAESENIYHSEYLVIGRRGMGDVSRMEITVPVHDPPPAQYYVRVVSDKWVGCESMTTVSFKHLMLPDARPVHTDLLDVHPMPVAALHNPAFEALYPRFSHFNPIQSQLFHALYHTDSNILVGAPTGSGKTITAELAILRVLNNKILKRQNSSQQAAAAGDGKTADDTKTTSSNSSTDNTNSVVVYIAPMKALARERMKDWKVRLGEQLKLTVVELTGDVTPDIGVLKRADVIITTPEKWDGITRGWRQRDYAKSVALVIIDEIHLLGEERGPVLEVIVSRMRFIGAQTAQSIRFVGLSTALANPRDVGDWLGISDDVGLYNFRPSVRPIPMEIFIQGFPGKHYCPRMATMNKPAYAAIMEHSPQKPVLIFVSSRRQTRLTALDLISYCAADEFPKKFLHFPEEEVMNIASTLRDKALQDTLIFGVGIHHAGLDDHDRNTVEDLFVNGKIQILVCTSTLAWGVNFPAHLVIVKGTEYFDGKLKRYVDFPVTDVLQMMGRAGRPQFDDTGVSCVFVHEPKKSFYRKFLHEPFPLESSLHLQLHNHLNAEIAMGSICNLTDCVEYLSWTFFFRRLIMNPSYYQLQEFTNEAVSKFLSEMIKSTLADLQDAGCIVHGEEGDTLEVTALGKIASTYYINYKTASFFQDQIRDLSSELTTVQNVCFVLAHASEFSELPVRHCEDELNADLAARLPWALGPEESMESSNIKTFLLLQAHFTRSPLPISDYVNDTKSVLDQVPRVLSSFMDIAALEMRADVVLCLVRIAQMVVQGLAEGASSLCQLPGVSPDRPDIARELSSRLKGFSSRGGANRAGSGAEAGAGKGNKKANLGLGGLLSVPEKTVQGWLSELVDAQHRAECMQVLRRMPVLTAECSVRRVTDTLAVAGSALTEVQTLNMDSVDLSLRSDIRVEENYELRTYLRCARGSAACRVFAPRINKSKTVSWWVLLSCTDRNAASTSASSSSSSSSSSSAPVPAVLLGMKRVEMRGAQMSVALPFRLPRGVQPSGAQLLVQVFADSIADIDLVVPVEMPQ
jgi:activating signal cointegrator complex subunit 3